MATLHDEILEDLAEIESDIGSQNGPPTFIWSSGSYTCIPSSAKNERVLSEGGFMIEADLVLSVRLNQFQSLALPQAQQTISYLNNSYRIINVHTQPVFGTYLRLFCQSIFRGA